MNKLQPLVGLAPMRLRFERAMLPRFDMFFCLCRFVLLAHKSTCLSRCTENMTAHKCLRQ